MVPAWVWSLIVVTLGCVVALWLGSILTGFNPWWALGAIIFVALAIACAVYNNFPFMFALGFWIPFFPHLLPLGSLPIHTYFIAWISANLFFRLCVRGYLTYRQSFNWLVLICMMWVPLRFLMNPIYKLGGTAGGSGISGAAPYFNYAMVIVILVITGAILNDRSKIVYFLRWCFVIALVIGVVLSFCAFIPATAPYLIYLGTFAAGDISDGIQRLVVLPGYGLFIAQCAVCPALMRLKAWQSFIILLLGCFMIVIGGNRSALAAAFIGIPVALLLRRKSNALAISIVLMICSIGLVRVFVSYSERANIPIPGLVRSFGVFDSEIDLATGGDASAKWRYDVWHSALSKIMESPVIGKGFGHLPEHVETEEASTSTDFETVLAGGEAHNGFINSAYGFGIPFTLALGIALIVYFFKESALALTSDKHDPEMRDLHAFLASSFATYPLLIYTAFDLSVAVLWVYVAISCILTRLPRHDIQHPSEDLAPLRKYGDEPRAIGTYSYRPR